MIVEKKNFNDEDGTLGWIQCIFDSSNILTSIYFPKTNVLYISFNRGGTYKYTHVPEEIYNKFENSESQGKFFVTEIKNKPEYPYSREYNLYKSEIEEAKNVIQEWKQTNQDLKN